MMVPGRNGAIWWMHRSKNRTLPRTGPGAVARTGAGLIDMPNLPPKLQEIVDDFASMTREEKIETLVAYAESFPPLPDWLMEERDKMEPVPECMTPVRLFAEKKPDD